VDSAGTLYIADTYNHTIRRGVPGILLEITPYENYLVVSWPVTPEQFQLQSTISLSPPVTWDTVTNGIVLAADRYVLTNAPSGSAMFYRLKR
jgi:hypothetical protein